MVNADTTSKALQVVVVDDEPQITDLLKTFLLCISKHLDIYTFNDPEEARAYLLQNTADMLITDYKMPKYDGIQLLKLMPKDSSKILISGFVSEITENQLREINASFLEKPVSLKDLDKLIRKATALKK
ncbi:MAG: response regulator [Chitinispirillaceae bacterium]|jgi:two-component system response regulator YesN